MQSFLSGKVILLCLACIATCSPARSAEPFQPWAKQGVILKPGFAGAKTSKLVSAPCVVKLKDGRLRLYCWTTGVGGHYLFAVETSPEDSSRWKLLGEGLLLGPAQEGNIRNAGPAFPWILPREGAPWLMYYVTWGSWAPAGELSNRTALAESDDEGVTWRVVQEPLLPLGPAGSFDAGLTGSVCVQQFGKDDYRMWYTAGERYELIGGNKRGIVHIGYQISSDGVHWNRRDEPLLSPRLAAVKPFEAVVSKPSVLKIDGVYHMWLSVFSMEDRGYRLSYARSSDGIQWQRAVDQEIIPLTPGGFDSVNQSYPHVIEMGDELWLFYAGDKFGATGIGWAKMPKAALKNKMP